eukprot:3315757-Lingulodinium_polyedra.AAC.1
MQEGAQDYVLRERATNPLFKSMYPYLCRDHGEVPIGTRSHVEATLEQLGYTRVLQAKGEKTSLNRWFAWTGAA